MAIVRTPTNFIYRTALAPVKGEPNPDKEPITEEERTHNRLKSRKRRVRQKMTEYAYKYMITLTKGKLAQYEPEEYSQIFRQSLIQQKIAFIEVTEFHKNGETHFHYVTDKKPFGFTSTGYDPIAKQTRIYSADINKAFGRNNIEELDDFFSPGYYDVIRYLGKYIVKQAQPVKYSRNRNPDVNVSKLLCIKDDIFNGLAVDTEIGKNREFNITSFYFVRSIEQIKSAYEKGFQWVYEGNKWHIRPQTTAPLQLMHTTIEYVQLTYLLPVDNYDFNDEIKKRRKRQILPGLFAQ